MGLDIVAYSQAVHLAAVDHETYDREYWTPSARDKVAYVYPNPAFADAARGLRLGVYRIDGAVHRFRAGSYFGYNVWREWLCGLVLGVEPSTVWNNPEGFADKPFYRLINFSDCEGFINAEWSARLARDFEEYQPMADAEEDAWYRAAYADWRKAFELAADGGFVKFH